MLDLIFDGQCGFCTRSLLWLRRLDRRGRIRAHPFQDSAALMRFGVSLEEARRALWVIDVEGRRFEGAAAVAAALDAALFPLRPGGSAPRGRFRKILRRKLAGIDPSVGDVGAAARGWRPFTTFCRLPGVRWALDLGYRWVAANRYKLPGTTPWCESHPEDCPDAARGATCSIGR